MSIHMPMCVSVVITYIIIISKRRLLSRQPARRVSMPFCNKASTAVMREQAEEQQTTATAS